MSHHRDPDGDVEPAVTRIGSDRLRFDEGNAIADRFGQLDDEDEKESFDDVFAELDEQFSSE